MADNGGFGVFSLAGADASVNNPGVDSQGRALRQRRHHIKSRSGCVNCKSRKIKCDEQRPTCRNCSTKRLECDFDQSSGGRQLAPLPHHQRHRSSGSGATRKTLISPGTLEETPGPREIAPPAADLESLRLMYHFEHFTSGTLLFGPVLWRDQVMPLALEHEHLMHAILTLSASHLSYLQPRTMQHSRSAAVHLDRALSGFRLTLCGNNLARQHSDVTIACGFLLLHYAWSVPFFNVPNDSSPSIESDGLLWFASGLKSVILAVYEREPKDGVFHPYMKADHVRKFYSWSQKMDCVYSFEQNFLRQSPTRHPKPPECGYLQGCRFPNAGERLVPIFRTVDAVTRGKDVSNIMPSVLGYTLMWPSKAMLSFQDEVRNKDPAAMIIMLSFYASTLLLLSARAWWAHQRSKVMCESILAHLSQEQAGNWGQNVSKITEYFGFNRNHEGNWVVGSQSDQGSTALAF
ncbi:hypothetical protein GGR52DRAFT_178384 [Hypoxylon sp. FL1284]|nr:hypothetical protein GGR52DRAFT_178384 [Hypoxylon sp. FL1284]